MPEAPTTPWRDPFPLADLVPGAPGLVTGIGHASGRVEPGDLFVALPGTRVHGARYAADAVARGAVAVLTDTAGAAVAGVLPVPVVVVADPRAALADLSARLAGRPADRLLMVGVTGTTGKTTTVFCAAALLGGLGYDAATIGTMGLRFRGRRWDWDSTTITTPEAPDLQTALARLAAAGCQAVAMEVSSHALALHRADAIRFAAAGFTNLGADHLDYHGDQETYLAAKARLFEPGRTDHAVIWTDDPAGARLAESVRADGVPVLTVGRGPADLRVVRETPSPTGLTHVRLAGPSAAFDFDLSLPGAYNVTDASVAVALVVAAGLDPSPGLVHMATVRVPGRVQLIDLPGAAPRVYVDFAHTPQAIASTLDALPHEGRLIAVIGAGGDRDVTKRGPMGAVAAERAAVVIVTDDNPRSEDPAAIRRAVLAGAEAAGTGATVVDGGDRRSAIRLALAGAAPGDVVAVLGKGHETTQEVAGEFSEFDDAAVVAEEWAARRKAA
jgi:UDP-N-acetylmuramoyl-L-alanyl-D-glutamate--2,6-diaminopimelate ligase